MNTGKRAGIPTDIADKMKALDHKMREQHQAHAAADTIDMAA